MQHLNKTNATTIKTGDTLWVDKTTTDADGQRIYFPYTVEKITPTGRINTVDPNGKKVVFGTVTYSVMYYARNDGGSPYVLDENDDPAALRASYERLLAQRAAERDERERAKEAEQAAKEAARAAAARIALDSNADATVTMIDGSDGLYYMSVRDRNGLRRQAIFCLTHRVKNDWSDKNFRLVSGFQLTYTTISRADPYENLPRFYTSSDVFIPASRFADALVAARQHIIERLW